MTTIDNSQNNTLADSLEKILPSCDRVDALVGYFYFSGFREIYRELQDKNIRILVWMEMDERMLDRISKIAPSAIDDIQASVSPTTSKTLAKQRYHEQFASVFNKTDWFDNDEAITAFKIFLEKIKDGSLEIRKTIEPHHAKDYILHYKPEFTQGGLNKGIIISGSSNLTYNGLKGQWERNRILREPHYYEEDCRNFEVLWNKSSNIIIANSDLEEEFTTEIKKRLWLFALPDPYLVYLRVLDEYFTLDEIEDMKGPSEITGGKFSSLQYQLDAINFGIDRINKFGGVIIADVVGLGKSIIASAIAHNLGMKTIVIAPPHLEEQWKDYAFDFGFKAQVYSTGSIDKALEKYGSSTEEYLIILDEAHKHRNEETDNYVLLHQLCAWNKVMALTATPFNNDPKDIYALIKLFDTPGQSTIRTVENLSMSFRALIDEYKKMRRDLRWKKWTIPDENDIKARAESIANELRRMIDPIVIRRSRLDLNEIDNYRNDLERQGIKFAKVHDPELLEYDLGDLSDLYMRTLERISSNDDEHDGAFVGARYKTVSYVRPGSTIIPKLQEEFDITNLGTTQVQIAKIMRRLLVRRFESSVAAFRSTLWMMIGATEDMLNWYEKRKQVPIFKKWGLPDPEELEKMDDKELEEFMAILQEKGLLLIPSEEIDSNFWRDLRNDLALLKDIHSEWFWDGSFEVADPKFDCFFQTIQKSMESEPGRKIIVFTEFSDTAEYVFEKCKKAGLKRVFKYSSSDASRENKETIRKNFDAGYDRQADDFDVLIATDAISEGYNLHRAGTIINYDIPYNPTRVIQRIGRINRINKKVFEELFIFNFFPTATGEVETKTKAIATLKMNLIHALLGEDTKIFTSTEELRNYFARSYRDAEKSNESLSWDAPHRKAWSVLKHDENLKKKAQQIPHRSRIGRIADRNKMGIIAFWKKWSSHVFAIGQDELSIDYVNPEDAIGLFAADTSEKALETTARFDRIYQKVKAHLFKDNTHPPIKGRRQNASDRLHILSEKYPPAKDYCDDVSRVMIDLDSLPEWILKELSLLKIDKEDPKKTYDRLREMIPETYIHDIFKTAERNAGDEQFVLLTEEFIW
ncbi:MAG: hypothetical protein ACD_71C00215G0009 [uncultured bacterium (gcode 4)]|uniref:Helicase protein n=1 Tax=uncultured bacterium (gcode 4) TaxID=1234023 RepID=K1Z3V5_9BACT|nr:MAG: hypothetical protein ACD_71C00215G0009 [uncultured bacterium (gcode 4)]